MTNLEYLYRKGLVAFNHFTDGEGKKAVNIVVSIRNDDYKDFYQT